MAKIPQNPGFDQGENLPPGVGGLWAAAPSLLGLYMGDQATTWRNGEMMVSGQSSYGPRQVPSAAFLIVVTGLAAFCSIIWTLFHFL
jgi:hypothetical protein